MPGVAFIPRVLHVFLLHPVFFGWFMRGSGRHQSVASLRLGFGPNSWNDYLSPVRQIAIYRPCMGDRLTAAGRWVQCVLFSFSHQSLLRHRLCCGFHMHFRICTVSNIGIVIGSLAKLKSGQEICKASPSQANAMQASIVWLSG